jgi:hypothetical protein
MLQGMTRADHRPAGGFRRATAGGPSVGGRGAQPPLLAAAVFGAGGPYRCGGLAAAW